MQPEEEDRMHQQQRGRLRRPMFRAAAVTGCGALVSALCLIGVTAPAVASAGRAGTAQHHDQASACHLGNGIKHVVDLTFDNVHFFRDNPNVPSDLQMMPNLLNFFEGNGTFLSNNHTPLIAHTAIDILTSLTGLYGDRQGMPGMNNAYRTFNP